MSYYTANGTRLTKSTQGFKMLQLIILKNGCTKYECVTEALGKVGSKQKLRGYYSCYFRGLVDSDVLEYNARTKKYRCTSHGATVFLDASARG